MNQTDNDSVSPMQKALHLWQQITGIDPNAQSFRIRDWNVRDSFSKVQEAIDLDPTQITAQMLLTFFLNEYLKGREVSFDVLLRAPQPIFEQVGQCRSLLDLLERPEIMAVRERFTDALSKALQQYDAANREDVQKLLAEPDNLAILRRDALRSMKQLRVDQFLDGSPESEGVSPVYVKTVHQWWNINSMLEAAPRLPSGVSLNLIRHPDAYQSYFAFMIRNGGNIFVLTDIEEQSHPLQGYMSRRPDRDLANRAARNWFPYDLLGMEYDEESRRAYIAQTSERGLVAYQSAARPLKPLSEVGAAEVVWLSMMFDLIVERFWRQGYKAPALSYTAEMLKSQTALLDSAKNSNLPVPLYQKISLPPLTLADVADVNTTEHAVGKKYSRPNAWMEERYGHKVPAEALNLISAPENVFAIEHKTGAIVKLDAGFGDLGIRGQEDALNGKARMEVMNATSFGSEEQIANDRLFIARCNFAEQINALAKAEYNDRKEEVAQWYRARVESNIDNLLKWAGNDGVWIDDGVHESASHWHLNVGRARSINLPGKDGEYGYRNHLFHSVIDRHALDAQYNAIAAMYLGKTTDERSGYPLCRLNNTKASHYVVYSPTTAAELAWLANCDVRDLPDVLQHWSLFDPFSGNESLSRVDPMI